MGIGLPQNNYVCTVHILSYRQPRILHQCSFSAVRLPRCRLVFTVTCYSYQLILFWRMWWAMINSSAADWIWAGGCVRSSLDWFFQIMCFTLSGVCVCRCVSVCVSVCSSVLMCVLYVLVSVLEKVRDREAQGLFSYITVERVSFAPYKSHFHFISDGCMLPGTGGTLCYANSLTHWCILF